MTAIAFDPLVDWTPLCVAGGIALAVLLLSLLRRARGTLWRSAMLALLWLAIANPVLVDEERESVPDLVTLVVDESPSQRIENRVARTADALARVTARLARFDDLEIRRVHAGGERNPSARGTTLFGPLARSRSRIPGRRAAATILLTDGQVHDVPDSVEALGLGGPIHVLLSGRRDERDRALFVDAAPRFSLVGSKAAIRLRVEDGGRPDDRALLTISRDGRIRARVPLPVGTVQEIEVDIDHAGANIFELEVAERAGELSPANNRRLVEINGVRERLRVLLVSGEPHPGERTWRNFLKADPSVDLIHFTILRPPDKYDSTPVRELSLIAFPIRELFEVKLADFDLIIFDHYRRRGVLPGIYLENIAKFVNDGGAVLEAAGPAFAANHSLYRTPLGRILPGAPTGRVIEGGFKPRVSDIGRRHPVTAGLVGAADGRARWGRWFRQIEARAESGHTLMQGADSRPLLIVDRVGEGRVAQLLSDHIWLWARGFETGGPHSEILRRLSHWLMKEPELEEHDLRARWDQGGLTIVRRSIARDHPPIEVIAPSGARQMVTLEPGAEGRARATIPAAEPGLYRLSDGSRTALAAAGTLNPLEYADLRSTPDRLAALVAESGGGIHRLEDGLPSFKRVRPDRAASGDGWFGLAAHRGYRVVRISETPALPALALLALVLGTLLLAWRREGR